MTETTKMTETAKKKHLLEDLLDKMPGRNWDEQEKRLHSAMFLSYFSAARCVIGREIMDTPLFGVSYDQKKNMLKFGNLGGFAKAPEAEQYTICSLDLIFACHARDMPLILEGETGVGKTITTEAYLRTTLPPESKVVMSLSHQSLTDSPKVPFERTEMRNGMPVTLLDEKNMRRIAAMYIDELNLGNPNDLLQLSYGRVLTSSQSGTAGILVPQLTPTGIVLDEHYLKRLWVSGSQNPPKSRDEQMSGLELTASLKNRFLVMGYPKILGSVGAAMWLLERENGWHEAFLQEYADRFKTFTGVEIPLDQLKEKWLEVYAYTLDAKRTLKPLIRSTLEFGDFLVLTLSGDLAKTYEREKEVALSQAKMLPESQRSSYLLDGKLQETEEVKRLNAVLGSFTKPLTERDDSNIKELADLFSVVKSLWKAFGSRGKNPLDVYLSRPRYVTVEDVAAGATLLARNKRHDDQGEDPLVVINALLREYAMMVDFLGEKMKVVGYTKFNPESEDAAGGLKQIIYSSALKDAKDTDEILVKLNEHIKKLKAKGSDGLSGTSEMREVLIARTTADVATAARFIYEHKPEIDQYLASRGTAGKEESGDKLRRYIVGLRDRDAKADPFFPIVYKHRLPRVI